MIQTEMKGYNGYFEVDKLLNRKMAPFTTYRRITKATDPVIFGFSRQMGLLLSGDLLLYGIP